MTASEVCVGVCLLILLASRAGASEETALPYAIEQMPEGYHLQAFDDCGVLDRQPHVRAQGTYEYPADQVDADARARSVAWGERQIDAIYPNLDPRLDYVVAITYANEPFNRRVQSLWAGDAVLHAPRPLPKGKAERLLFRVPREAIRDAELTLHLKLEGEVNVVVSVIELWAPASSPDVLHIAEVSGLYTDLQGRVLDLKYEGLAGAAVAVRRADTKTVLATTSTGASGAFTFARNVFDTLSPLPDLEIVARHEERSVTQTVPAADLTFEPVRYRPIPTKTQPLDRNQISLDGTWRIHRTAGPGVREQPLNGPDWGDISVPGQWVQQGYDLPQDKPVAMAKEFEIPAEWTGRRVMLRFDAIHAGTRYWLNGRELGHSENLFTPTEWDITDAARPGLQNRLDIEMLVDTPSERLSFSCGYAFHNLGGIDRSVRLFVLPPVHVRALHVSTDLDNDYRDAEIRVAVSLSEPVAQDPPAVELSLFDPDGHPVALENHRFPFGPGEQDVIAASRVAHPMLWNAEKPALYRLVIALKHGDECVEQIERAVGFRKIEVRDGQLYLNGARIKLAGACHHEIDPLTGRADTARYAEQDVRLMKAANLNYIRTSHYPPTDALLDAADRLGMYVEVEAPFCWVAPDPTFTHLRAILTPTSAMIDYCHAHPSVVLWSLANESAFNPCFEASNQLCKNLDPTRPTTFNNPDPKRICDIANLHYPPMPYDAQLKDDPRPLLLGEYFFPVCHEQTDVRIDPGLRLLWGAGHSDPGSEYAQRCAAWFASPMAHPSTPPGAWSHIAHSNRVIGAAIWAALDEPYYLPDGRNVGYAWHHGFWGVIDAWRRVKPEWFASRRIFNPIWFPVRRVDFVPGMKTLRVPVENRHAFTNLNEYRLSWQGPRGESGPLDVDVPPGQTAEIEIPVPHETREGDLIFVIAHRGRELVNSVGIRLGKEPAQPIPQPQAGAPKWKDEGNNVVIQGKGFALVLDRTTGDFNAADARHRASVVSFPSPHVTRFDFGDLAGPNSPPYAVFPDPKTRRIENVTVVERADGLEIAVQDRYDRFAGRMQWLIDRKGAARIAYDYEYSGEDLNAREIGIRFLLRAACDTVAWRRGPEWIEIPREDDVLDVGRSCGEARARYPESVGVPERTRPAWPWLKDDSELGSTDFRSVKFNVYEASLTAADESGVRVLARADAHVRACLDGPGVMLHLLSDCPLSPISIRKGDHLKGERIVQLLKAGARKQ